MDTKGEASPSPNHPFSQGWQERKKNPATCKKLHEIIGNRKQLPLLSLTGDKNGHHYPKELDIITTMMLDGLKTLI